jgi:hypothetical protein
MTTTVENNEFIILPDLLRGAQNNLLSDIVSNNVNDRNVIKDEIPPNSTYSSLYNKIDKYINIPHFKEEPYKKFSSFKLIQEWEGYVQEIDENNSVFTAALLDITENQKYPTEEADFKFRDVNDFDRHFLRPGAAFRWIIGYYKSESGTKRKVSELVFRRKPFFDDSSLKKADKKAKEFKDEIIWE